MIPLGDDDIEEIIEAINVSDGTLDIDYVIMLVELAISPEGEEVPPIMLTKPVTEIWCFFHCTMGVEIYYKGIPYIDVPTMIRDHDKCPCWNPYCEVYT